MTEYEIRKKAIEKCDEETQFICYCGRLATGLHTNTCKKYKLKVEKYMKDYFREKNTK